ncbi:hypothetical protein DSO57_1010461 [Entomophthora muscae]|uniref:Uncharacterized protein n=1 Tax=Entomophthora muscae TaxID=34485 RepID=A0ACC2TU44_9FUNG|nr:hypothetical protein DSO57_1010461 [Entomophthora muscae]
MKLVLFIFVASGKLLPHSFGGDQSVKCDNVHQFSGFINTGPNEGQMYAFFEAREQSETTPLIVWLNGVPDQPPIFGTSAGMSPCLLNSNGSTSINPYAWNDKAHVLFFDMYKQSGYTRYQLVKNFIQGLVYDIPQYTKNGIHIFAQSYHANTAIIVANMIKQSELQKIETPLLSVGLGNPIIDMPIQMTSYVNGLADRNEKLEDISFSSKACNSWSLDYCESLALDLAKYAFEPYLARNKRLLNTHGFNYATLNKNINSSMEYFLRSPDLKRYIKARDPTKLFLSDKDFMPIKKNIFDLSIQEIEKLLGYGVPVLIYAGFNDFISNIKGLENAVELIQHNGQPALQTIVSNIRMNPRTNEQAYLERGNSKLTLAKVYNAGHLAQYDQPESTQLLVESWIDRFRNPFNSEPSH